VRRSSRIGPPTRRALLIFLLAASLGPTGAADARPAAVAPPLVPPLVAAGPGVFAPPAGDVLTGVTGGSADAFAGQIGKQPAVFGYFTHWNSPYGAALRRADAAGSRLMLHISTTLGYGIRPVITPGQIAQGAGDGYVLDLARALTQRGRATYIRLLAEMNQTNNPYCAFNPDGTPRANTTAQFKQAFRRVVLIFRGGPTAVVNRKLARLHLPPVRGSSAAAMLPQAPVSILWVPQVSGTPGLDANSAQAYYPGDRYVDWVGTDFFSKFPNFAGLERFYTEHPSKPFTFGEWAIWDGDAPGWAASFFDFVASHRRVQMLVYNQGLKVNGPYRLNRFPASREAIRKALSGHRFLAGGQ